MSYLFIGVDNQTGPTFHQKTYPRSRYTSGRSFLSPEGDSRRDFVRAGNLLSARVAILVHVCAARKLRWLLEQPSGTCLANMPWFQKLWSAVEANLGLKKQHEPILCLFMGICFYPCPVVQIGGKPPNEKGSPLRLVQLFFSPGFSNDILDGKFRPPYSEATSGMEQ